ncbi:E3 ubiquitin-protein ligase RNF4-like [Coccinella septempunctata]|uniref:E3 ubiquitin-protein ligase RNF4-like n=1 Tax=Coccinella septempunctata TaxID=41139 RepID=UPI001D08989A|nr:E3 ubiquitin-protein ligase RNF4-like [Coccinella septempunctata]
MLLLFIAGLSSIYVIYDCLLRSCMFSNNNESAKIRNKPKRTEIECRDERNVSTDDNCSICMDGLSRLVLITECKHEFHYACITDWIKINNTCPCCRREDFM